MAVRDGTGWDRCDMERYGTKGASMNQIMVNAVEFDSLLKEVEYLKHENQKLEEQLKDAQGRIRVLKEEVGFAERGYTRMRHPMTDSRDES
jgi:predicted  nucleic acid-binding Zn-ribbon protein